MVENQKQYVINDPKQLTKYHIFVAWPYQVLRSSCFKAMLAIHHLTHSFQSSLLQGKIHAGSTKLCGSYSLFGGIHPQSVRLT